MRWGFARINLLRMFWIVLAAVLFISNECFCSEFWIAPNGSDSNPGTKHKPLATLERARDAVRQLKRQGSLSVRPVTVWLHSGDYLRTNTFELTALDAGTVDSPIVWRAYHGAHARLLGGRVLTGFRRVSDPKVLGRLDTRAQNNVIEIKLRELGLNDFGELQSRGFGRPTVSSHCELFYGHKPMTLACWPNEGQFAIIDGYPASANRKDEHGGQLGELADGFLYTGERPRKWNDIADLWVHGYWAYDWANSYEKVTSLDVDAHLVKTAPPYGIYGFRKGQRFYFINVLEELDQPGEWFLDRSSGILYFWPPQAEGELDKTRDSGSSSVHLPEEIFLSLLGKPLLTLDGVSNVTFQGLILEGTRANAVEIHGGSSNSITGCIIRNVGNSGVVVEGGSRHSVCSCDILDTGDSGVSLTGGDRKTLTPGGHFVENCHFQRQGRWSKCYVPAIALNGVGLRASHNLIHDHPHCAILFWGNDHLMEFNEIHHIALETGDVGAIYTGRDYSYRGNKIRYNFIHHTGGVGMGSMGVYMDDCVSGTEVFGNIFYKAHWAMFIGGGRDHRVQNNVFVDCEPAIRADGRGLDTSPVWRDMVNKYMRDRLADTPQELYRARYPDLQSLDRYYGPPEGPAIQGDSFHGVPAENNLVSHNVCSGKWVDAGWHAGKETLRLENNLTNAAASFVSAVKERSRPGDFALRKDSPAWALGFQPIPLEKIGLQENKLRRELKHKSKIAPD